MDDHNRSLNILMRKWDARIHRLKDEILMYIIQRAEYEMNIRHEKEDQ